MGHPFLSDSRQYRSEATSLSSSEQMLGGTLLGARLKDLRSIIRYLAARDDLDAQRLSLWGESFAAPNPPNFPDPLIDDGAGPTQSEPVEGNTECTATARCAQTQRG